MADQEVITNGFLLTPVIGSTNDPLPPKKKRNLPGNPDPEAEVIALSPKTLMATNRFLCEICGKGFQRDQNLQLHRRGHNLPWKLKQRTSKEPRKRVYVCPEKSCVHHHPSRALGDLTGIKKHFCRKHGEKKWKCEKCNKKYAVQSDWKAHSKTCGTREYKCDCGTIFSRRDSFITHRAFCDALAEETARMNAASTHFNLNAAVASNNNLNYHHMMGSNIGPAVAMAQHFSSIFRPLSSSTKDEIALDQHQNQRGGVFPLWLGNQLTQPGGGYDTIQNSTNNISIQAHNIQQHLSSTINSLNSHNTPLGVLSSNPHQSDDNNYHHLNWVFGSKISNNNNPQNNKNIGEELGVLTNEITSTTTNTTTSLPSLYSIHHQTSPNNSSHIMSATALLYKAAQMGSTSSTNTNDAFFDGNFGLVKENNNEIDHNNFNRSGSVFGTSNSTTTNAGSDVEGSVDDLSTMTTMYTPNPAKRQKLVNDHVDSHTQRGVGVGSGGQTRDFLGVGSQPAAVCQQPSSVNGWI
ncbi:zinc finger protein NUTCRACKER-like isoform X1 [Chenopodium quinoa]|uniref:zinc finger protein NUTCRACKER-like isoform X1 n=1 Tax=Chenopodium quinoa TaxID=63459 RepID=UPI000B799F0C|nr:zinc finger protein NUTCRACKER-like isoform X1 [Chenopodium quinoa]